MEIIEVSSYTENEKLHIAKDHLIAKQLKKNGVNEKQLKISDKALREVIAFYTREAGVRGLERRLGEICRKAARRIYEGETEKIRVSGNNLEEFLGKPKYREDKKNKKDEIGIVRGLAWTSVGGVTLEIEVNVLPGKGELVLTGKLGDVMKESARAGISYIRSISLTMESIRNSSQSMIFMYTFRRGQYRRMDHLPELRWHLQSSPRLRTSGPCGYRDDRRDYD